MEELDQKQQALSEERGRSVRGRGGRSGEESVNMAEKLVVGLTEPREDKVDLGVQLVRAELSAPAVSKRAVEYCQFLPLTAKKNVS